MRLILAHPEVAGRSCEDCKRFIYRDTPDSMGEVVRDPNGNPRLRPLNVSTPCHRCPKIPKGMAPIPASAVELSEKNWRAFAHYRRCKAVGRFPVDEIVEYNAAIILGVEESVQRSEVIGRLDSIAMMLVRAT